MTFKGSFISTCSVRLSVLLVARHFMFKWLSVTLGEKQKEMRLTWREINGALDFGRT